MSHRSLWLRLLFPAVAIAAAIFSGQPVSAEVLDKTADISGTKLEYKVILPNGYDAAKAYPGILAFGGGSQTMDMVDATLRRNWREQAETLGYIVVLPAAPNGICSLKMATVYFPSSL